MEAESETLKNHTVHIKLVRKGRSKCSVAAIRFLYSNGSD